MEESQKPISITGATGFVGRYIVRELLSRGCQVRALVRDRDKARRVLPDAAGLTLVTGDLPSDAVAAGLVDGARACINLIGIIREAPGGQTFRRMHVETTRALVHACERAGVGRFLQMSAIGVRPDGPAEYQRTKYEAERILVSSDLRWTIFRPSVIHGPDGELVHLIKSMASGEAPPYFFMPYFVRPRIDDRVPLGSMHWESAKVQPISVLDVAWCFAEAIDRPRTEGEIYNLVGDEVFTWPELYRFYRDTLPSGDTHLQPWHVPAAHAALFADAADRVGLGKFLPFDAGQARMAAEDSYSESAKVHAHFNLSVRPFRATVEAYASAV